jgi:alginate O-acetyltransferase complex protein AlgI
MLFNSLQFFVFFPIVTAGYFVLPHRFRWFWLLAASCYFYMAFIPAFILILCFTITVDYFAGIFIEESQGKRRKMFLLASIFANVGALAFFKYFNFLNTNLAELAGLLHLNYPIPFLRIILPIGLSFHTFQSLAYTIEVYRGKQKAERKFGILALYVLFYPQLVAGPIERPQNLIHQFYEEHVFDYKRVTDGLKLMLWGFFKKMVIADRLAHLANPVFDHPHDYQGPLLLLGTIAFAYQIYCDFSGYTDIAIGAARVMGFRLMKNFDTPYCSKSISEMWRRWHISLSTWFRDYLYISMGGNRVPRWRWFINLFVTFVVSGFWHGANWTFIIWGGLHGFYLVFSIWTETFREKFNHVIGLDRVSWLLRFIQVASTFGLVCFAWIFFRANSLSDATYIITHLFSGYDPNTLGLILEQLKATLGTNFQLKILLPNLTPAQILFIVAVEVLFLELVQLFQRRLSLIQVVAAKPLLVRWSVYYVMIFFILLFGVFEQSKFIYFQF